MRVQKMAIPVGPAFGMMIFEPNGVSSLERILESLYTTKGFIMSAKNR